jgi:thiol-disulfide isomerase/thioredoxin
MLMRNPLPVWTVLAVALIWLPGCTSESPTTSSGGLPTGSATGATTESGQPPAAPPVVEVADATSTAPALPDQVTLPEPAGPDGDPPVGLPELFNPEPPPGAEHMASAEAKASWMTDFEQAKAKAQAEGKDLLIDFTGSDWCGWCIRLDNEVFAFQPFYDYADENFVLVKLDFPRGPSVITEEQSAHNNAVKTHYGSVVGGFPTILLADAEGRAYARTGFEFGGPTNYVAHLTGLQEIRTERDAAFTAAAELEGAEKAKKIEEGLLTMAPPLLFPSYESEVSKIIELDADNAAGLNEKYTDQRRDFRFLKRVSAVEELANTGELSDVADELLKEMDALVADFPDHKSGLEMIASFRIVVLRAAERFDAAIELADSLLAGEDIDPRFRSNVLNQKIETLVDAKRLEEAILTMDALLATTESPIEKTQMLVTKAEWQVELKQLEAAKATFVLARETGGPRVWERIDAYEARLLAKPPEPESTEPSDPKPPAPEPAE